jgi:hypothetical protein
MPPAALPGLQLHARRAIPGPGGLAGPPPGGRTGFTAAGASMPPAALPGLQLHARRAIPGPGGLAGPPPGGRTSGRPCSCAWWRAAFLQTNPNVCFLVNRWTARGGPCQSSRPCQRAQAGCRSELARSDRRAGCPQGASGEMARATPSLRHPRRSERPAMGHGQPRACGTHDAANVRGTGHGQPRARSTLGLHGTPGP